MTRGRVAVDNIGMGDLLKNLAVGAGSILEFFPRESAPLKTVRIRTVEEALAEDWRRVGAHLRKAMISHGVPVDPPSTPAVSDTQSR